MASASADSTTSGTSSSGTAASIDEAESAEIFGSQGLTTILAASTISHPLVSHSGPAQSRHRKPGGGPSVPASVVTGRGGEDPRQKDHNGEPQVFYFNRSTGKSQWAKPEGWSENKKSKMQFDGSDAATASSTPATTDSSPASVAAALAAAAAAVVSKRSQIPPPCWK